MDKTKNTTKSYNEAAKHFYNANKRQVDHPPND